MLYNDRIKNILLFNGMAIAGLSLGLSAPVHAITVYEDLPTSLANPPNISWHNRSGPIIADDFIPIWSGQINHVTWWGSIASSNLFEIVLQNNNPALGEPALTPAGNSVSGGLKQFVSATSFLFDAGIGIWQFDANVAPGWTVGGGQSYWFTAANSNNGWSWAQALNGPTVGQELYNAQGSTGGTCTDGGPHCGPWSDIHTDFAFRINAVPEPSTWAMIVLGFGVLGLAMRRRNQVHVSFA